MLATLTPLVPLGSTSLTLVSVSLGAFGTLALLTAAVTYARAIGKTNALVAWRAAAEGYEAQVGEVKGRLERADERAVSMQKQIEELSRLPDMTGVIRAIDGKTVEVLEAVRLDGDATRLAIAAVKEAVDDLPRTEGHPRVG